VGNAAVSRSPLVSKCGGGMLRTPERSVGRCRETGWKNKSQPPRPRSFSQEDVLSLEPGPPRLQNGSRPLTKRHMGAGLSYCKPPWGRGAFCPPIWGTPAREASRPRPSWEACFCQANFSENSGCFSHEEANIGTACLEKHK
jgi:hypothetical protein